MLKFRGAFLLKHGSPEKWPRVVTEARKCGFDQQHENLCSLYVQYTTCHMFMQGLLYFIVFYFNLHKMIEWFGLEVTSNII